MAHGARSGSSHERNKARWGCGLTQSIYSFASQLHYGTGSSSSSGVIIFTLSPSFIYCDSLDLIWVVRIAPFES